MVDDDRSLELKRRAREVSFVSERLLKVRAEVVRLLDEPSGKTIVQQEARRQKSVRLARAVEIRKLPKADQAFETLQRTLMRTTSTATAASTRMNTLFAQGPQHSLVA